MYDDLFVDYACWIVDVALARLRSVAKCCLECVFLKDLFVFETIMRTLMELRWLLCCCDVNLPCAVVVVVLEAIVVVELEFY